MNTKSSPHIRKLDINRDLLKVADLIENSFGDNMDKEGKDYLRQIRRAAVNKSLLHWIPGSREQVSYPLYGYVWEENNQIIGNISVFPYLHGFRWRYLIANVAVDQDHRGKGIGKSLTQVGVQHSLEHGAQAVWLQVREDNTIALQLYRSLGFIERTRRGTWHYSGNPGSKPCKDVSKLIRKRRNSDWPLQSQWLDNIYPPEVTWYMQFSKNRFSPGLLHQIEAFFTPQEIQHYTAESNGEILGMAILESKSGTQSILWMAPRPEHEQKALDVLLNHVRNSLGSLRRISMNYPANCVDEAINQAGFIKQNTLIWMEKKFF